MHACLCVHKMSSSQEVGFNALDDVFAEKFGPLEFADVDAFIDSQFDRALGGEEEIFCSIPEDDSKKVIEREDGGAIAMPATLRSLHFTYGSNTQVELDGVIPLVPEEEAERSGFICSRCREIVDRGDCEGCYASTKTTTREAASKGCAGGVELKGTRYMLTFWLS